jgi:hypothetical protein
MTAEPQQSTVPPGLPVTAVAVTEAPPVVAGATLAKGYQEAVEGIVQGVGRFLKRRERDQAADMLVMLASQYPERPRTELQEAVQHELRREREFMRLMEARLRRDLPAALRIADPQARSEAVQSIISRERRYVELREQAAVGRLQGALEQRLVEQDSPQGAFWVLDPRLKTHTPGCELLAGKAYPHALLRAVHPPLHVNCGCRLVPLDEAIARGLMTAEQVPTGSDALASA